MKQFDRQYRLAAGPAGGVGFEVGRTIPESPTALHIRFIVDKCDTETPNTATISLWNLNPEQLAILNEKDCVVTLKAGYDQHIPQIFIGTVTYIETSLDGGDRETYLELADGRVELRDSYISLSYSGVINTKKIIEDVAAQMGITVSFSYNAEFVDLPNSFSFIGLGRIALDKACASSGLQWAIQDGILQIRMIHDTMTRQVYLLNPKSGLLSIPKKINYGRDETNAEDQTGYTVEYLLNGAIGIGDYIRLESKVVKDYFQIKSLELRGDNIEGDWMCSAKLIKA